MTVFHLVPPAEPVPPTRADRMLAALIIVAGGIAPLGQGALYLLAAIGALSLVGR